MWRKLAVLGLIEAALIVALLTMPISTHAVKYMTADAARGHGMEIAEQGAIAVGLLILLVATIGIPIWMTYLVLRSARTLN